MRLFLVICLGGLAGCDSLPRSLPTIAETARVDGALSQSACIAKATDWHRHYQYRSVVLYPDLIWWPDREIINFRLTKVGEFAKPGVSLDPPNPPFDWIADSTPTDLARGSFNLIDGRLKVDFCGPNYPTS